ncbi:hypothetical protein E2562_023091 [Oryza meyeriana var. granulata]|uniref:Uncharacterized protein n=1 Tax=Oryza meyeriana var. granulata TaxID=110450 RepID=A0A6G1EP14_9ORYZ|nr:hypothetical protein E2562_023091 [Oryza meyeriana var. granulata]
MEVIKMENRASRAGINMTVSRLPLYELVDELHELRLLLLVDNLVKEINNRFGITHFGGHNHLESTKTINMSNKSGNNIVIF